MIRYYFLVLLLIVLFVLVLGPAFAATASFKHRDGAITLCESHPPRPLLRFCVTFTAERG